MAELAKVNSPYGAMARQYFGLEKDQLAQRSVGNIRTANFDASQMTSILGNLQHLGDIAPDKHMAEIKQHLQTLNTEITGLRNGIQKVSLVDIETSH